MKITRKFRSWFTRSKTVQAPKVQEGYTENFVTPAIKTAEQVKVLTQGCFNPEKYEYDFSFRPAKIDNFWETHTTAEMLAHLDRHKDVEIEARVAGFDQSGRMRIKKYEGRAFQEAYRKADSQLSKIQEAKQGRHLLNYYNRSMREGGFDTFAAGGYPSGMGGSGLVGQDFTPLLGGPYFKNLYYYQDYLRMHVECFYAYHHDPMAKAITQITKDFVMGRGYDIKCDTENPKGKMAKAVWAAFEEANNLQQQMQDACGELGIYGEIMVWKLPLNLTKIVYQPSMGEPIPKGIIPRVRIIDPSNIVEIVTTPEDITRPLFYVWLTPTQYQIYNSGANQALPEGVAVQPTLKFIYQTIPASEVLHYRVNAVSNEKRGRSDYFPILGYLKRLRDSVEYSMIALQKVAAWSIDTTIDGDQVDINNYAQSQANLGTVAPSGSEFVHSKKVSRQYLGNQNMKGQVSDAFLWNFSMICAGVQIPANYFGTHLSGGQTRAGAIVATEPVAKKMESRRMVMQQILEDLWNYAMESAGLGKVPCQIIFPEIITQDRSLKLKDLALAQEQKWVSAETAATMAAKEFGIGDYNYTKEMDKISQSSPNLQPSPLTSPGLVKPGSISGGGSLKSKDSDSDADEETSQGALTSDDRSEVKKNGSQF